MFHQFLNKQTNHIESSAFVLAFFTFIGSFLSIIRNALLASTFGASKTLDIYYAAFRIPDFIFNIFILGALAAGFIPLFIKYQNIGKKESNEFATSIMVSISFLSALFGIVFVIFADIIVKWLFPGFDLASLNIIANLSRIMMIQPIVLGLSSLIGNILQVNNLYMPIALAPLLYNVGIIIGIVWFYPIFGVYGLGYGVVLGAFLNLIIKYWPFRKIDFVFSLPHSKVFKQYIKEFSVLTSFRALSIINLQLFLFVISNVASYLQPGSLGIINFALNIQDFPRSVFAMSFAVASFPILSRQFTNNQKKEFTETYKKTLIQILSFLIPIFFAFLIFRSPIVRLLLGYGKFDWTATNTTISIFTILVFGFIAHALQDFLLNTLFAANNTIAPFVSGLGAFGVGSLLSFYLGRVFGLKGLAISYIIADILYALFLFISSIKYFDKTILKGLIQKIGSIFFCALIASIFGFGAFKLLEHIFITSKVIYLILDSFVAGIIMIAVYLFMMSLFKIKEFNTAIDFVKQKLFVRKFNIMSNQTSHNNNE